MKEASFTRRRPLLMSILEHPEREMAELELALLRRGMDERAGGLETCSHCRRSPLIGEWVYIYERQRVLCELCRSLYREAPSSSHLVHTPAFGNTLRIIDQRPA
jgi:CRISPR/Cas system-associated protein Cas10 (large subunit of type III CRISPR-Cas system)